MQIPITLQLDPSAGTMLGHALQCQLPMKHEHWLWPYTHWVPCPMQASPSCGSLVGQAGGIIPLLDEVVIPLLDDEEDDEVLIPLLLDALVVPPPPCPPVLAPPAPLVVAPLVVELVELVELAGAPPPFSVTLPPQPLAHARSQRAETSMGRACLNERAWRIMGASGDGSRVNETRILPARASTLQQNHDTRRARARHVSSAIT